MGQDVPCSQASLDRAILAAFSWTRSSEPNSSECAASGNTNCCLAVAGTTFGRRRKKGERIMRIANTLMIAIVICLSSFSKNALAHCDTLDGPVVEAARVALETGNIDAVLIWVQAEHEAEVRSAFSRSIEVRALGDTANQLADMYFFETVVRLHREGEGARERPRDEDRRY